ncbi:group II intron reverse transcriptase/maturase [Salipaludibacillus sp. CUR1]|uniref:group II intron reverse transcriptase/maturase n=1 Tax=Salipaludibacillus sp. CUR1 TaxID=2820003 RepID=UPI001E2F741F|nr:group II intron reverse transcriptase/maturase [Salipaludibacillus sp. CUR1]MCE7793574.1 group II intron reverse transcriptase/maturase [Salipaludibacillus sp. CUR1]
MLEKILHRDNLNNAYLKVVQNKGSQGVDGITIAELKSQISEEWSAIRQGLLSGTYQPSPIRRVEIPKPDGGKRMLGIPTVMDRLIQQSINLYLQRIYDPTFSENSYGFRPKRRAHDAVLKAKQFINDGHTWVVDIDLEKFFDKVNHDRLMRTLSYRISDRRVLSLIRKYLQAGIMENGLVRQNEMGTPQGSPLSPLLSNIVLDELDKELEKRGIRFVRYADDCQIYTGSKKAAERIRKNMITFIEGKLKLKVNREKSAVDRPWKRKFLGFSFTASTKGKAKIRIHGKSIQRVKDRIREMTSRKKSIPMEYRIDKLNRFIVGWRNYFRLAETPTVLKELMQWIRRRLRMIRWKEWKAPKTKARNLIALGVSKQKAHEWGNTRKGYWRIACSPILHHTLNDAYWRKMGLKSLI